MRRSNLAFGPDRPGPGAGRGNRGTTRSFPGVPATTARPGGRAVEQGGETMRLNLRAPGSVAGVTAVAAALAAAGCTLPGAGAGGSAGANTGHGSVHVSSKYVVAYDGTGGTNPDGMDHGG